MTMKKQRTNALLTTPLPHYNQYSHPQIIISTAHHISRFILFIVQISIHPFIFAAHPQLIISTVHSYQQFIISTDPSYPQLIISAAPSYQQLIISAAPSYQQLHHIHRSILFIVQISIHPFIFAVSSTAHHISVPSYSQYHPQLIISVLPFSIQFYSLQSQFYIKRCFARNLTNLPQFHKSQ